MANHHLSEVNLDHQNGLKQDQVEVVMVPFPAQGHLNQLLHLSRIISSSYNIKVHYVGFSTHNRQARSRIHGLTLNPNNNNNIQFHDFPTPKFLSNPPDPFSTNKFPSHLLPSFNASSLLRHPLASLLRSLAATSRRVVVIYDFVMASVVQDVASIPNAESFNFQSLSAFWILIFFLEKIGKPIPFDPEVLKEIPSLEGCLTSEFMEFVATQIDHTSFNSGNIYNTCKVIEGPYIEILRQEQNWGAKYQWAIGPFNPVVTSQLKDSSQPRHKSMQWLDKQDPNSVIFVSFGTTTTLSDDEIKELAIGLEQSNQKFIWVLRDADRGDVFIGEERKAELPEGYEERVREKGMVVRDWAPQLEILGHPSTGGFMSHCGWNSCMESMSMGVPIAAWPMHSDQPRNSFLITKLLKIGVVVSDWGKRDELVRSETIEKAVKTLMETKEGEEIRERAADLGRAVRRSVEEGGVSRLELNSFIAHITR